MTVRKAVPSGRYLWCAPWKTGSMEAGRPTRGIPQVSPLAGEADRWSGKTLAYSGQRAVRRPGEVAGDLPSCRSAARPSDPRQPLCHAVRLDGLEQEAPLGVERARLRARAALRLADRHRAAANRSG